MPKREHATTDVAGATPELFTPATKRCTLCGVDKSPDSYGKQKGGRYGLHPRCKECRRAVERQRYADQREEILARMRDSPRRQRYTKEMTRLRRYGVTTSEFGAMIAAQVGRAPCAAAATLRNTRGPRTRLVGPTDGEVAESGRSRFPAKEVRAQALRGFKSHPLRSAAGFVPSGRASSRRARRVVHKGNPTRRR